MKANPLSAVPLADGYRDKVQLATKLPPWLVKEPVDMDTLLNAQLQRLQTDRIDYYLIHALSGESWNKMNNLGVGPFLDRAKSDGRIRRAGFSFHGVNQDFIRIVDSHSWDFCQIQYNYLDTEYQAGRAGLNYAFDKGLGVIIMEPLRGGMLAHKAPPAVRQIWDQAPTLRSEAAWSLRWIWNHPQVCVVLSGMSHEDQVAENLQIADEGHPDSLTDAELQLITEAGNQYRQLMKIGCTGCGLLHALSGRR